MGLNMVVFSTILQYICYFPAFWRPQRESSPPLSLSAPPVFSFLYQRWNSWRRFSCPFPLLLSANADPDHVSAIFRSDGFWVLFGRFCATF